MGKMLKILGWVIAAVFVLIVAAVVILPQVVDPNDYKEEIVAAVKKETGRNLTLDGDIGLSVFPWLGLELGTMVLDNPEGFDERVFASVEQASVRVKLMPLLQKQLEVDKVSLDEFRLNLIRTKEGGNNWDDLGQGSKAQAPSGSAQSPQSGGYRPEGFSIDGVEVTNARVIWDDRQSGQHFSIDPINLKTGALISGEPVKLELAMALESRDPALRSDLDMSGVVALDEAAGVVAVEGLELALKAEGEALPKGLIKADLNAGIRAALDGSLLEISGLKLTADTLTVACDVRGSQLTQNAAFNGNLEVAEFDLGSWLSKHGFELPEMADPKALSKFSLKTMLAAENGGTKLDGLAIRLDDTQINGDVSAGSEGIKFNLKVDDINVDRYLPKAQEGQSTAASSGGSAPAPTATDKTAAEQPLYPIETLRQLNLDGVIAVGRMVVNKLLAEDVEIRVKAANGQISSDQQVKKFYQGGYEGALNLDVRGESPVTQLEGAASGIRVGPLLADLSGEDRLTGQGRFSAKLKTSGNSIDSIKRALAGNMKFRFEEGALKGVNIARTLRETKARFSGKPLPPDSAPLQTDFSEISGSGVIANGMLNNSDLLAKSPFLRVTGKGKVNLVAEVLDYTVQTVVVRSDKGQGGEGLEELEGVKIPIYLTGPLAAPAYKVDWETVLVETQKARVKEKVQEQLDENLSPELKEKIEKNLPPDLQNKLKGLFN